MAHNGWADEADALLRAHGLSERIDEFDATLQTEGRLALLAQLKLAGLTLGERQRLANSLARRHRELHPPPPVAPEVEEMRKRSEQAARKLFDEADEDGSGFLDQEEIIGLAARLGHKLNGRQARHAMAQMDEDGNGEIDFDEFYAWWVKGDITSGPEAGIDYMQQVRRRPAGSELPL